jgi:nucleoside-diphosphate-sugar epimerase
MNKVLVTGASGFIGWHTLAPLLEAGFEVHAVSLPAPGHVPDGVQWYEADLLDRESVRSLLGRVRPSHLMHFAWFVEPGKYWTSMENLRWVQASLDLVVEFARCGGKRAVLAGTCAEYDWSVGGVCHEQKTPAIPATLYGASKLAVGTLAGHASHELGINVVCGRIFFPYGPREPRERLVPSVICSLLKGEPALCTDCKQERDFIFVHDVAAAFTLLLNTQVTGPVNVGTGTGVPIADVVSTLARIIGRPELLQLGALPNRPGEPASLIADAGILRALGFVPRHTIEEGARAAVAWWEGRLGTKSH